VLQTLDIIDFTSIGQVGLEPTT